MLSVARDVLFPRASSRLSASVDREGERSAWDAEVRRFQPVWDDAGCCRMLDGLALSGSCVRL